MDYLNISTYRFVELTDLVAKRVLFKSKAVELGIKGSILLSLEGINLFLAGSETVIDQYLEFLAQYPELRNLEPKRSFSKDQPFRRMLVKIKKEIISMGKPEVIPSRMTGKRVMPKELKSWYDEKKPIVVIDTRNDYEINLGTFKNAVDFSIKTFRQFPEKLEQVKKDLKDKTVVMFCTGGIRCEKATALAQQYGIEDVYQLEGGILKYFEEVGSEHYNGECFVFDQRVSLDPELKPTDMKQCYACRAVLTPQDQRHEKYKYAVSCPHCA
ncbi:MAG: sulfurtransferase [Xanthomonadaceae bacterium]|nr:sulfurtransferase [Xanthomonadaceae bacterium]